MGDGQFPAYEDLTVATALVCRGEPQDDDDDEPHGEGTCVVARDAAGPLLITILTANARKRLAHERARILAEHYGMPVRVVSVEGLVAQFPNSPFAGIMKEVAKKKEEAPGKFTPRTFARS
jgi:hypothetical protein